MFAVVIPVPDELSTALQPFRQKFDPQANYTAAHISILPPFDYFGPLEPLHEHLGTIGDTYAPVRLSLAGWDIHRSSQGYQLRLPLMAGRKELSALRNSLCSGILAALAEQKETGHWPYIQFGQVASHQEIQQVRQQLAHFEPQFIFRATGLELLHRTLANEPWQTQETFGLMATLASPRRTAKPPQPLALNQSPKNQ